MAAPGKLRGMGIVKRRLQRVPARINDALGKALYQIGNEIMTDAKKITPVDKGTLRASGYVTLPQKKHRLVNVELGFGGPAEKYAAVQHEALDYKHTPPGQAKFLEAPFNHHVRGMRRKIAAISGQAFDKGDKESIGPHPKDPNSKNEG